jgi:hypothetical protein
LVVVVVVMVVVVVVVVVVVGVGSTCREESRVVACGSVYKSHMLPHTEGRTGDRSRAQRVERREGRRQHGREHKEGSTERGA